MSNTNNSSGWVAASGQSEASASNYAPQSLAHAPQTEVGQGGIEINGAGPIRRDAPLTHTANQEAPLSCDVMSTVRSSTGGPI